MSDHKRCIGRNSISSSALTVAGVSGSVNTIAADTPYATTAPINRASTPKTWITRGPAAANPMSCAAVEVRLNKALADISCSRRATTGIVAPSTGAKNWPAMPNRNVTM